VCLLEMQLSLRPPAWPQDRGTPSAPTPSATTLPDCKNPKRIRWGPLCLDTCLPHNFSLARCSVPAPIESHKAVIHSGYRDTPASAARNRRRWTSALILRLTIRCAEGGGRRTILNAAHDLLSSRSRLSGLGSGSTKVSTRFMTPPTLIFLEQLGDLHRIQGGALEQLITRYEYRHGPAARVTQILAYPSNEDRILSGSILRHWKVIPL